MRKFTAISVLILAMLSNNGLANNNAELVTINYLLEAINKSQIYQYRIKPECLVIVVESSSINVIKNFILYLLQARSRPP